MSHDHSRWRFARSRDARGDLGERCLTLLSVHSVGRIAFVDRNGQPRALPVNYVLDGRTVAFRTDPGAKLESSILGKVAFEIDAVDKLYREGWSVLVTGVGRESTDGIDRWSERVRANRLHPWASGSRSIGSRSRRPPSRGGASASWGRPNNCVPKRGSLTCLSSSGQPGTTTARPSVSPAAIAL